MDKLYVYRKHDQWRGKPIYIEDEIDTNGYEICLSDVDMQRGNINTIMIEFEDENKGTYADTCTIVDYERRIVNFKIPLAILSNKGEYAFVITVSFNDYGEESRLYRSARQTFKILETIEMTDNIQQSEHYPILLELINEISQYKVDTSNFPTFEDLQDIINSNLEDISLESIMLALKGEGYITKDELTRILLNYVTLASLSDTYARKVDLGKYVLIKDLTGYYLTSYAKLETLNMYVKKQEGKGLSTHDLTDELYRKLLEVDTDFTLDEELLDKINNSVTLEEVYSKEEVRNLLENLSTMQPKILSFACDKPTTYRVGESVGYITFNWDCQGSVKSIKLLGLYSDPQDVTSYVGKKYYYDRIISQDTTITLEVTYMNGDVLRKDIKFTFSYPLYYGVGYDSQLNIESYAKSTYIDSNYETVEIEVTSKNQRIFLAVPSSKVSIYEITDENGMSCISSFSISNGNINSVSYSIYTLNYEVTCNNFKLLLYVRK